MKPIQFKYVRLGFFAIIISFFCACSGGGSGPGSDGDNTQTVDETSLAPLAKRADNIRPLPKKRFIPLIRQPEYLVIGDSYKNDSSNNVHYIDPLKFNRDSNGNTSEETAEDDDVMWAAVDESFVASRMKAGVAGSFDDDVQEEVAVVSWDSEGTGPGLLSVIDAQGELHATVFSSCDVDVDLSIQGVTNRAYHYRIATGDVDSDGYDEIIIAGRVSGTTAAEKTGKIWVLDDKNGGYATLGTMDLQGRFDSTVGYLGLERIRLASGNVDSDPADEIVVAYVRKADARDQGGDGKIYYTVFDDATSGYAVLYSGLTTASVFKFSGIESEGNVFGDFYFNMDMGDLDGDTRDEIVFLGASIVIAGEEIRDCDFDLAIQDDAAGTDGLSPNDENDLNDMFADIPAYVPDLDPANLIGGWADPNLIVNLPYLGLILNGETFHVVSIDEDKRAEIILPYAILDDFTQKSASNVMSFKKDYNSKIIHFMNYIMFGTVSSTAIGDVDGDFRNNIIFHIKNSLILVAGYKAVSSYDSGTGELIETHLEWKFGNDPIDERGSSSGAATDHAILVPVNVDNDSLLVECPADNPDASAADIEESHTVSYGDLRIIAILAAPPTIPDIGQCIDCSETWFSTIEGSEVTAGAEVGGSISVIIGTDAEISTGFLASLKVASFETELAATVSASVLWGSSGSVENTITYTAGPGDHQIVFSATPYDRYTYKIVGHIDDDQLGKEIVVEIPQETRVYSWTLDYFNDHNGAQMDIDTSILQSVPGHIHTYPTPSEKDSFLTGSPVSDPSRIEGYDDSSLSFTPFTTVETLAESDRLTLTQGETGSGTTVEVSSANYVGGDFSTSVTASFKGCGALVCAGASVEASMGVMFEVTWSSGLAFSGWIGGAPAETWLENQYDFGIFAYKQSIQDIGGETYYDFIVLNYWVEQ
ncbi:MAG: hypothetical protein KKD44_20195 [Proteobacteria bacterium]|nr:hypothetical protein [Pseudomonadota bacterium]